MKTNLNTMLGHVVDDNLAKGFYLLFKHCGEEGVAPDPETYASIEAVATSDDFVHYPFRVLHIKGGEAPRDVSRETAQVWFDKSAGWYVEAAIKDGFAPHLPDPITHVLNTADDQLSDMVSDAGDAEHHIRQESMR